jgi:hypothetical protein
LTAVPLNCPAEGANVTALTNRGVSVFGAACP